MVDDEAVYKNEGGTIIITKSLAKFDNATYPIASIGSVNIEEKKGKDAKGMFGFVLLGLIVIVSNGERSWLSSNVMPWIIVFFFVGGFVDLFISYYPLKFRTSSGDQNVFASRDKKQVEELKAAIEKAVMLRG